MQRAMTSLRQSVCVYMYVVNQGSSLASRDSLTKNDPSFFFQKYHFLLGVGCVWFFLSKREIVRVGFKILIRAEELRVQNRRNVTLIGIYRDVRPLYFFRWSIRT